MGAFLIRRPQIGSPFVIGHDGTRVVILARDRCSPNSAMRNAGKPDGSSRWLGRATGQ